MAYYFFFIFESREISLVFLFRLLTKKNTDFSNKKFLFSNSQHLFRTIQLLINDNI